MQPILVLVGLKKKNIFLFICLLKCEKGIWKFPKDKNISFKPLLCLDTCWVKVGEGLERIGVAEDPTMPSPPAGWILMSEHRILPKHYHGFPKVKLIRGSKRG